MNLPDIILSRFSVQAESVVIASSCQNVNYDTEFFYIKLLYNLIVCRILLLIEIVNPILNPVKKFN